ncbi:MAG: carbohydrate-binding protein [Fibrobacteraceae bacterium]|nr:carbohydrate-binding protein [Fibrobacteraceae bacterium]
MKSNFSCIARNLLCSVGFLGSLAVASNVSVTIGEEHQVIRGFGGMVHNTWQGGAGLSDDDAKIAFGTGDGTLGLNTLRIPVNGNSSDFGKEVAAAKAAKKYAGDDFILYATPWTSQYAGGNQHVASSNYQNYVNHLNSFAEYMKNQGVPLYAISISNEPDWCSEWACWSADEIYNFTRGYADQMRKHGTKVISAESFRYDKNLYNKVLNDASALKNWDILGAHFYASEASTADNFFQYSLADQKNVERWMTEHYTESQGSGNYWRVVMNTGDQANQNKRDTVRAMDVAYEIHRGLVLGNFNQYTWWYIRRCYGLIMEKDFSNKLSIPQNEIGKISKRGYLLSQYARFVRPGFVRIGATAKPEDQIFVSAFKNADSLVVVIVNRDISKKAHSLSFDIPGLASSVAFTPYTTTETKNVEKGADITAANGKFNISISEEGVTTLVAPSAFGPPVPREIYGGTAAVIPGKVEAENFDISGSADRSYYDSDGENKGGEYRKDEGVDIEKGGTNYAIGYTTEGEWLEYTVDVAADGDYDVYANIASGSETSSFQLLSGTTELTPVYSVPKTGEDWATYKEEKVGTIKLKAGKQIIRLAITGSYVNIDYLNIVKSGEVPAALTTTQLNIASAPKSYSVFNILGKQVATVLAKSAGEAGVKLREMAQKNASFTQGVYWVRGNKESLSVQITK